VCVDIIILNDLGRQRIVLPKLGYQ